jgi:outer membrane protein OmpU
MSNSTQANKHFFYGTTALATVGLIAGVAGNAAAAERIKIGVHGYHQQWLVGADQDYNNAASSGAEQRTNALSEKHNSEICFVGETTLDNGLTFGVNVQLEANTSADQIDESYLYVQSDSLGQLLMGSLDNSAYLLHVTAPDGGVSLDSGDVVNNEFYVNPGLTLFDRATGTTFLNFSDDDSGKVNYISPRFSGVQLGVSFIPNFQAGGDSNSSLRISNNNVNNGFAGAINYTEDFNGFGVQLSAGYLFGDTGADSVTGGNDNLNAYDFGAQFGYAGFSFGGAYSRGTGDDGFNSRFNSRSWIVGATYETGPYTVGINYMKGEENPTSNSGKGHLDQAVFSGTYRLGPGIRLVGGLFWFDGENEDNSQENKGWGATTAFKLGF